MHQINSHALLWPIVLGQLVRRHQNRYPHRYYIQTRFTCHRHNHLQQLQMLHQVPVVAAAVVVFHYLTRHRAKNQCQMIPSLYHKHSPTHKHTHNVNAKALAKLELQEQ